MSLEIPLELLCLMAELGGLEAYRALLALPKFARFALRDVRKWKLLTGYARVERNTKIDLFRTQIKVNFAHYEGPNLHRLDGPAIEYASGTREWRVNDVRHREDGPAVECADGTREWWVNGKKHRVDGPAIEYANGTRKWRVNGEKHRLDGPAVEYPNGPCIWYKNDKIHREDGPAIEHADGTQVWYIDGKHILPF